MCELRINENAWYWKEKEKTSLILRDTCQNGLIDKLEENLQIFANLKWELLLTKKQMTKVSMRDQIFYTVSSFKKPEKTSVSVFSPR